MPGRTGQEATHGERGDRAEHPVAASDLDALERVLRFAPPAVIEDKTVCDDFVGASAVRNVSLDGAGSRASTS
jgi:hypothetical protein